MRKLISALFILSVLCSVIYAGDVIQKNYVVDVDTTGVVAINKNMGRKGILLVNDHATYKVYLASCAISSSTYKSVGSIVLQPAGGYYEDNYYVYKSTYYAASSTGTVELFISEKE